MRCLEEGIRGQLFIAGDEELNDATLTVMLVDCRVQDVEAKVLSTKVIGLPHRPANNWVRFSFHYPPFPYKPNDLQIEARIEASGRLLYITKVAHSANLAYCSWERGAQVSLPTVVIEPV